jgi:hypothetical protein
MTLAPCFTTIVVILGGSFLGVRSFLDLCGSATARTTTTDGSRTAGDNFRRSVLTHQASLVHRRDIWPWPGRVELLESERDDSPRKLADCLVVCLETVP